MIADAIDRHTDPQIADTSMMFAYHVGRKLSRSCPPPPSLAGMTDDERTSLVLAVVTESPRPRLPVSDTDFDPWSDLAEALLGIAVRSAAALPDVADSFARAGILLRLWSGTVTAGKVLADETMSGANTEGTRAEGSGLIDLWAGEDPVFDLGLEVAILVKLRRRESFSFTGVPLGSRLDRLQAFAETRRNGDGR